MMKTLFLFLSLFIGLLANAAAPPPPILRNVVTTNNITGGYGVAGQVLNSAGPGGIPFWGPGGGTGGNFIANTNGMGWDTTFIPHLDPSISLWVLANFTGVDETVGLPTNYVRFDADVQIIGDDHLTAEEAWDFRTWGNPSGTGKSTNTIPRLRDFDTNVFGNGAYLNNQKFTIKSGITLTNLNLPNITNGAAYYWPSNGNVMVNMQGGRDQSLQLNGDTVIQGSNALAGMVCNVTLWILNVGATNINVYVTNAGHVFAPNPITIPQGQLAPFTFRTDGTATTNISVISSRENPSASGTFGAMEMNATNLAMAFGAQYTNVTVYTRFQTNGFTVNTNTGYMTNRYAGYYRCNISISFDGLNSGTYEGCMLTNDVDSEIISWKGQFDTPARYRSQSAVGVIYLPAGTGCAFAIKQTDGQGTVSTHRAAFVIGTP